MINSIFSAIISFFAGVGIGFIYLYVKDWIIHRGTDGRKCDNGKGEKIIHLYHVCCKFENQEKSAYWNSLVTADRKINSENYEDMKQSIWDKMPDNVHENFERKHMGILSLSYLHEDIKPASN
jgi:hypothetical protein